MTNYCFFCCAHNSKTGRLCNLQAAGCQKHTVKQIVLPGQKSRTVTSTRLAQTGGRKSQILTIFENFKIFVCIFEFCQRHCPLHEINWKGRVTPPNSNPFHKTGVYMKYRRPRQGNREHSLGQRLGNYKKSAENRRFWCQKWYVQCKKVWFKCKQCGLKTGLYAILALESVLNYFSPQ